MSKLEKYANLAAVVVPFVALIVAIAFLWNDLVGPSDLAILAGLYLVSAFGITIGYHRLLTHRAFDTPRPVRYALAIMGQTAVQGPVIDWVADHRKHHAFTDEDGDPHSPHGHGGGFKGALHGLYHAHVGWLFKTQGRADRRRYARDLMDDPVMKRISKSFLPNAALGLVLAFALGLAITGRVSGGLTALLWGGLVRIFFLHHVTWSINSVCHFFGRRRFAVDDHSTNVFWLALPSLGESWHHNHHAFPRSAHHGMRWWEIDVSGLIILAMKRLGLARDVVTVSPEKQAERLAARRPAAPPPGGPWRRGAAGADTPPAPAAGYGKKSA
jgi:stearoyl-CoA desaturase (delta-9 desaturase)